MRTFVLAGVLVFSLAPRGFAAPTAEDLRKIIAERCAKVDHFSLDCEGCCSIIKGGGCWGYFGLRITFDRPTKRMAFGLDGLPALLVQDRRAFFLLYCDGRNEKEAPTYVEIRQERPIAQQDIVAALRVMKKEGEPYGYDCCCCVYDAYKEVATRFLTPFLDGTMGDLFSKKVQPLDCDARLLAANMEKGSPQTEHVRMRLTETEKLSEIECGIFALGHPDSKLMQSPEEAPPHLAPEKFPICFKTKDDSSSWVYAFNRESGVFLGVIGTVDQKEIFGSPGNEVVVYVKACLLKDSDECKPMPLDLPKNARIIGVADLKSDYRRMLSETNAEELRERIAYEEGELQKRVRDESDLSAKLAKLSGEAKTDKKTLEDVRSQLVLARGETARYAYHVAKFQQFIEARERLKVSKPSRKEGASAKKGK